MEQRVVIVGVLEMIDADDHNAQQLERIFDECVDEGMSFDEAEIEAYKRFEQQGL
jgi:predicted oxidoreductase